MTLREKFKKLICKNFTINQLENIAEDYAIEILERYHNSLFNIPLKEGEAKRIVEHIKKGL